MKKQAFLFIGQSGAGKGTQAALFEEKIRTQNPDQDILHLETGSVFRSFITNDSYTAKMTKAMIEEGKLPPSFIGVHVWSHELIEKYNGQNFVFLDGTPRIGEEVPILLSAATFYGWEVHVIFIDVGDSWANDRLVGRGRVDDEDANDRAERIAWFHSNTMPAINMLEESPLVKFLKVNGERPIPEIHEEICKQLLTQ